MMCIYLTPAQKSTSGMADHVAKMRNSRYSSVPLSRSSKQKKEQFTKSKTCESVIVMYGSQLFIFVSF